MRALQALADAHNELDLCRDPDPKQQMIDKKREKKRLAKEMKAFNKKHHATSGSRRAHSSAAAAAAAASPTGRSAVGYSAFESKTGGGNGGGGISGFFRRLFCLGAAPDPQSPATRAAIVASKADDGNYIGNSGVPSLVPGGKVRVVAPIATASHVHMHQNSAANIITARSAAEAASASDNRHLSQAQNASSSAPAASTDRYDPERAPDHHGHSHHYHSSGNGVARDGDDFGGGDDNSSGYNTRTTTLNLYELPMRTNTTYEQ